MDHVLLGLRSRLSFLHVPGVKMVVCQKFCVKVTTERREVTTTKPQAVLKLKALQHAWNAFMHEGMAHQE